MSYITAALKRAQKANDERYLPYRSIISARPRKAVRGKKRLILGISLASLVLLASTAFSLIIYFGQEAPPAGEEGAIFTPSGTHRVRIDGAAREPSLAAQANAAGDAEVLFQAGLRRQQAGALDEAEAFYRRAIEADPKNLHALNNLGVICMNHKRDREAIDIFNRLIDVRGDWADPYYNLACLYSRQGDTAKGLWYLKVALWMNKELKGWARNDADLETLRQKPEYQKIVN